MNRVRFSFARGASLKYISHLDMMRLFNRALRRSKLPLAYSEGFNPHPQFNLAAPLPLAVSAVEELGEVYFTDDIAPRKFLSALQQQLPRGIELTGAVKTPLEAPSLPSLVGAARYSAVMDLNGPGSFLKPEIIKAAVESLLQKEEIIAFRHGRKKKKKYVNVRPYIIEISLESCRDSSVKLNMLLQAGSRGGVSPLFIIAQLEEELGTSRSSGVYWKLQREKLYIYDGENLLPMSEGM